MSIFKKSHTVFFGSMRPLLARAVQVYFYFGMNMNIDIFNRLRVHSYGIHKV